MRKIPFRLHLQTKKTGVDAGPANETALLILPRSADALFPIIDILHALPWPAEWTESVCLMRQA